MKSPSHIKKIGYTAVSVLLWLLVWEALASHLKNPILLPYPYDVFREFCRMFVSSDTRETVLTSLGGIASGFFLALILGILLGITAGISEFASALFGVPMKLIRTIPVASFVILLLVWIRSSHLGFAVSFLMVLPVIYENVRTGVTTVPGELSEMAAVFRLSFGKRLHYLILPNCMNYLSAALKLSLGLCWKAGVAAEVIGLSAGTIGRSLYDSKLYLDMPALFSWTVILILVSLLFEELVMILFRILQMLLTKPTLLGSARTTFSYAVFGKEEETEKAVSEKKTVSSVKPDPAPGSVTVLTGPSGIGKTTALRALAGLEQAGSPGPSASVSYDFQEDRLLSDRSALENVTLGDRSREKEAGKLLALFGIETASGKPAKCYSGGEKRRIALARAVHFPSDLLLLDEPFTGIEPELSEALTTRLALEAENRTIVIVTHIPSEISNFKRIFEELGRTVSVENVSDAATYSEK